MFILSNLPFRAFNGYIILFFIISDVSHGQLLETHMVMELPPNHSLDTPERGIVYILLAYMAIVYIWLVLDWGRLDCVYAVLTGFNTVI